METLYGWCEAARAVLDGPHRVGRVIARPFVGVPGSFRRTGRRRDFAVPPPGETLLDRLAAGREARPRHREGGRDLRGPGGRRSRFRPTRTATASRRRSRRSATTGETSSTSTSRDFDARYGHRNDARGFARALEELDGLVPALLGTLREDDLLLMTADHGCDPTDVSTEHTREYVPARRGRSGRDAAGPTSGRGRPSPTSPRRSPSTSASHPSPAELPRSPAG